MQAILAVLINPVSGHEDAFNDWYTHVHIRDVMRFPGSIRVQQLIAAEIQLESPSHRYFTMYDTFDPALLSQAHRDAMGTRRMVVAQHHDKANMISGYYYPVTARTNDPVTLTSNDQPVILEQFNVAPDEQEKFETWFAEQRLPVLLKKKTHISSMLMRFEPAGQLSERVPPFSHIAIWRVEDLATAIEYWRNTQHELPGAVVHRVACFTPMDPYLTRDAVLQSTEGDLHTEEAARRRAEGSTVTRN